MCILFGYINNEAKDGEYQLVIANNRDEIYDRHTAPAARWRHNPACISGVDLKPEVPPGGTWIGLSTHTRKIASLLNIVQDQSDPDPHMRGRGCLVTDFISSDVTGEQYLLNLKQHAEEYNPFNLLLLEQSIDQKWTAQYYSKTEPTSPLSISDKVFGLSNSPYSIPWQKVCNGKKQFDDILRAQGNKAKEEELVEQLLEFLSSKKSHLPDPHLEQHAPKGLTQIINMAELNKARSCINVELPQIRYGSRTHTVILVDSTGGGHYVERTMVEPIDGLNPKWRTTSIRFSMGETLT